MNSSIFLKKAKNLSYLSRIDILNAVNLAKGGHLGGSLSVVDILSSIYCFYNKYNFELILSKGHCVLAWLCVLHRIGEINKDDFDKFYSDGSKFAGHPKKDSSNSITWSTGSLGHGLSVTCGKALANKRKKFFCILGDGETNEGSIWEGLMFLSQHQLTNVLVIIDNNKLESLDLTNNILSIENLENRLSGFNFQTSRIDGHNQEKLLEIIESFFKNEYEIPLVVIADTIKGKGVSFMENVTMWHHRKLKPEEFSIAIKEIENKYKI